MVACPHAVNRFVEDTCAGGDLEGGASVITTTYEDVVDPPERPVPISDKRIAGRECVARISGILALPGIPVADARAAQGLTARPEAHTGRLRIGIEVADQHHVQTAPASSLLHEPRGSHGLQFALMLEVQLPIRQAVA